jgi:putative hemolysin
MEKAMQKPTLSAVLAVLIFVALVIGAPPAFALANPASVFCVKSGGKSEIRNGPNGQYGVCILPDGRVVEEWKFYRDNHGRH